MKCISLDLDLEPTPYSLQRLHFYKFGSYIKFDSIYLVFSCQYRVSPLTSISSIINTSGIGIYIYAFLMIYKCVFFFLFFIEFVSFSPTKKSFAFDFRSGQTE